MATRRVVQIARNPLPLLGKWGPGAKLTKMFDAGARRGGWIQAELIIRVPKDSQETNWKSFANVHEKGKLARVHDFFRRRYHRPTGPSATLWITT